MSPTVEKKPAVVALESNASDASDAQWKAQRKLKYQRDLQKRANATNAARRESNQHSHSHGPRSIPGRGRKDHKSAPSVSPLLLSRSVPTATARSWPPDAGTLAVGPQDPAEENLDPNWTLDDCGPLATSAPEISYASARMGRSAKPRAMTLFESALIFNEAGNVLSHDNFDEMAGSSPELGPQSMGQRRKTTKRRVGRHRPEKKKEFTCDRLTPDDVVLELMHVLLPDVDVTKELNLLFLGGPRHHGDVFHFEHDSEPTNQTPRRGHQPGGKLLHLDVLKFKAALTKLLFGRNDAGEWAMPLVGTPVAELVDHFFSEQWIASCLLRVVKLDVLAQYDAFAVLLAVYRALPSRRDAVLKGLVGVGLAVYDHQAMDHLQTTTTPDARKLVSMKGTLAMLNAILAVAEMEITETPEVFGDSLQAIDEALDEICARVVESIKLLMRSSPGGAKYKSDDNNQVEKFQEGSDSVEATTYSAVGEVIYRLASFSPMHGQELLTWMLRKWPQRNVQLQLFYVRFITGILIQFTMRGVFLPEDLITKAFTRLRACIQSPHFLIAKEASSMCGNLPLMDMYLSRDPELREQVSEALHANATGHWNDRIRQMSDEYFDLLLDFA